MAFTYIGDLSTDLDWIRFHIGDTVDSGHMLPDAVLTALFAATTVSGDTAKRYQAAAMALRAIHAKFITEGRGLDEKVADRVRLVFSGRGDVKQVISDKAELYDLLALKTNTDVRYMIPLG